MAIGLGRIFGFTFLENFNYPYISKTVTEFWRRWHISLGAWFRDYVYIPLGGNRTSKTRWIFNILIVWMLTGLWHGAGWPFVIWGLFFAVLLIAEKLFLGKLLSKVPSVVSRLYTILMILASFVLFNSSTLSEAVRNIGGMFGLSAYPAIGNDALYYLRSYAVLMIVGVIGCTPLPKMLINKISKSRAGSSVISVITPIALAALLLVCTAYLVDGSFNPFIYFRF